MSLVILNNYIVIIKEILMPRHQNLFNSLSLWLKKTFIQREFPLAKLKSVIKGDRVTLNIYKLSRKRKFDYYIVNELLRFLVFYYI